ncbi:MAG TPA: S8 family serine peptidase [Candidatus Thermoplasmatota archaeon]|nr:S8 family serine peptidase [Candidatus Thermoplasmatota archaeon]
MRTLNPWKIGVALLALALAAPLGLGRSVDASIDAPDVSIAASLGLPTNHYLVGFYKDPFLKVGQTYNGARILAVDHDLVFILVEVSDPPLFQARAQLDDNVRYVEFDDPLYAHLDFLPNDPGYSNAGHYGTKKVGGEAAWDRTLGSTSVKVAMVDSGVYRNHEDLAGGRLLQGWDFTAGDSSPDDESGCSYHGSHTTGTMGATINNGKGIAGMSQSTILPVKGLYYSAPYCTASDSMLVNALKYAGDQGAHISSNSWGGGGVSTTINDAIQYSHDRGVIHIAAAGNDGPCTNCVGEPWKSKASISIIVASTTSTDTQSSFSSEGNEIDVSAPGSNIYSLGGGVSTYQTLSGTSMATPLVAGTAALIKALQPSYTFAQMNTRLTTTGVDLGPAGWDTDFGYGRINADAATNFGGAAAACGDGLDNDGDGLTDYPADPGCTSTADTDETNAATGCTGGPANNCFASATSVAAGGATVTGSNVGANTETGEPSPCGGQAATVWWMWTAGAGGTATIDTTGSGYDTVAAVYTGSAVNGLTTVGCNDDIVSGNTASKVTWTATAGTTYRIQVGGYNGATGSITLKLTAPATQTCGTPANNNFGCSTAVGKPSTTSQSTSGATLETSEPRPCATIGGTVWFTYTASASGTVTIDTFTSNYDTALAVYTGSALTGLTNVGCNDDTAGSGNGLQSRVSFSATAGTTYRIQAGGYNGATGSLVLHVA